MRSDVRQVVTLAAHGARFLEIGGRAPELLTTHRAFATVHAMEFRRSGAIHGGILAESVAPWFRRLEHEGVVLVRPLLSTCPLSSASEAVWGVLTDGDRGMEIWRPNWRARVAGHDDPKPFRVTYTAERFSRWHQPAVLPVEESTERLAIALSDVADRLKRSGHSERAFAITRCLDLHLEGESSLAPQDEIWPECTPVPTQPLLASAVRVATVISHAKVTPSAPDADLYARLWTECMLAFEAANPAASAQQAA